MHTLVMQKRLQCLANVLDALKLEAIDRDLATVIRLGATSVEVAALAAVVREQPAQLLLAKEDRRLRSVIAAHKFDWPRFARLLPRLIAAAEEMRELSTI